MDLEHKNAIIESFKEVTQEGGEGNFLIVNIDIDKTYYVQYSTANGSGEIYAEVVSNQFIPDPYKLKEENLKILEQAGWEAPEHEMANYSRTYSFSSDAIDYDLLIQEIDFLCKQVFEMELPDELELTVNLE